MRAVTLLFHDVVPAGCWDSSGMRGADADVYKLDCSEFRQHLRAIAQRLLSRPVTAPALLDGSSAGIPILFTFDDGGVSAQQYIADILDEFEWKAHFLITAGRIGTSGFLDRAQIRELHRRGHVIGSHSFSHPARMSHCTREEIDGEWQRSVTTLAEITGESIQVASVPCGYYSRRLAYSAAKHGIRLLFNSEPVTHARSVGGCLVMGRFTVQRGYSPKKSAAISSNARLPQFQQYLVWNCKKVAKVLGGRFWLRARIFALALRAQISSKLEP
jgi:peptidoglycan/xylan/chitin deacetylase (PgdA/CDA1 family)